MKRTGVRLKTNGLSLIELLIALGLAGFILAGTWRVYYYFKPVHGRIEQQISTAYELQLVDALLRDKIRRAGFTPCMPLNSLWTANHLRAYQIKPAHLTLSQMSDPIYSTRVIDLSHLLVDSNAGLSLSKKYLIADCYHAEIVQLAAIHHSSQGYLMQLVHPLGFQYTLPIYLGEWLSETFYIHDKTLMVKQTHSEMLSPEITDLQVTELTQNGVKLLQVRLERRDHNAHQMVVRVRAS